VEDGGGGGCAAGSRGRLVWTVWLVSTSQNWWVDNCSQGNGKAKGTDCRPGGAAVRCAGRVGMVGMVGMVERLWVVDWWPSRSILEVGVALLKAA
jgi:hypothetical protein